MSEEPKQAIDIPQNLQMGLEKIESTGVVPLFIPQALENFLSEQGIYRSSMTPEDAWQALRSLASGETPSNEESFASPAPSEAAPSASEPAEAPAPPTSSTEKKPVPMTGLQGRLRRKRKHR